MIGKPFGGAASGMRVAVTGGAGFVGVQLVQKLLDYGAVVYVLDNLSHGKNIIKHENVSYLTVDVSSPDGCEWAFKGGSASEPPVDIVFNLAASVAGVLHNIGHHHEMFQENILLQTVPVAVADHMGIEVFLQTSSVCAYSPLVNHPSFEDSGLAGEPHPSNAGYAWAKRMGERAVEFSNIKRAVIVRPSNVFGPLDYYDDKAHVIPALIRKLLNDDVVKVYGGPNTFREFIYSADVADGMIAAALNGRDKRAYNLSAPENVVDIGTLLSTIMDVFGMEKRVEFLAGRGGGEILRWASNKRSEEELGWVSGTTLVHGLMEIRNSISEGKENV